MQYSLAMPRNIHRSCANEGPCRCTPPVNSNEQTSSEMSYIRAQSLAQVGINRNARPPHCHECADQIQDAGKHMVLHSCGPDKILSVLHITSQNIVDYELRKLKMRISSSQTYYYFIAKYMYNQTFTHDIRRIISEYAEDKPRFPEWILKLEKENIQEQPNTSRNEEDVEEDGEYFEF